MRLPSAASTLPWASTSAAPTGTSPRAAAASASASASSMAVGADRFTAGPCDCAGLGPYGAAAAPRALLPGAWRSYIGHPDQPSENAVRHDRPAPGQSTAAGPAPGAGDPCGAGRGPRPAARFGEPLLRARPPVAPQLPALPL